ncbi:MAG: cytochrome c [Bacteroidota bacterium]
MKKSLFIFALLMAVVWACGGEESSDTSSTANKPKTTKPKAMAVNGKAVYQKNCIVCHGVNGDMGASGAFNLTTSQLAVEERVAVITNGRNAMASYKNLLKEEEIQAVAEYTMTLAEN